MNYLQMKMEDFHAKIAIKHSNQKNLSGDIKGNHANVNLPSKQKMKKNFLMKMEDFHAKVVI